MEIQDGHEKSKYGHFNSRWSCKIKVVKMVMENQSMVTLIQDGHGNSGFKMVMKNQNMITSIPDGHVNSPWSL